MKRKKFFSALVLTGVLACGIAIGAGASGAVQNITAQLDSTISIQYNNEVQTLLDANGNRVFPVTYNGTTYLPVRAVAGLVGLDVGWNNDTRTVVLGPQETRADLIATLKPYTTYTKQATPYYSTGGTQFIQAADKLTMDIGGVTVDHWFALYNRHATGQPSPTETVTASFNLDGKYNTLSFKCYSAKDTTLTIYGDNETVLAQYEIVGGQVPQTYTVNLMGTNQLSFVRAPGAIKEDPKRDVYCYVFEAFVE